MFESSGTVEAIDFGHVACAAEDAPWWVEEMPVDPWSDADVLADVQAGPVGAGMLMNLLQVDPSALTADEAVTFAQQVDRFAAFAAGLQHRARAAVWDRLVLHGSAESMGEGRRFVTPEMLASAEMAAALRLAPRSMDAQLDHSGDLAGPMVSLREAMLAGEVSAGHASAIARELTRLPSAGDCARAEEYASQCARILEIVIPYAATHTPGECGRRTRGLVLRADPVGAKQRRQDTAEREHGVWMASKEEGSCEITAVMPIAHGRALLDAVNALAANPEFETSPGCVTVGQRRVAALITLALGDPGGVVAAGGPVAEAKLNVRVDVVVPLSVLTRGEASGAGGVIAGEAVSADVILDLLAEVDASSTLRRIVVDAAGCIVDAGRTRYAISDTQRHLIALRDGTCRFPGCSRAAVRCEIDHAIAYEKGGRTDLENLGPLCKHHHQLKTHGGWTILVSRRTGACTWRSPLGRVYDHHPPGLIPAVASITKQYEFDIPF